MNSFTKSLYEKTTTAVILAAGLGSRISEESKLHPKGFIKVGDTTLIERSVSILKRHGITRILIGTGHLSEWYDQLALKNPEIHCVKNEDFHRSGSLHTLYLLKKYIAEDFLLLESDLIYEGQAIQTLEEQNQDAILVSEPTHSGDEVYVEADAKGFLKWLSKDKGNLTSCVGEFIGISKITLSTYQTLCDWVDDRAISPSVIHYEEGLASLFPKVKIPLVKMKNFVWAEIDTVAHLERVNQHILTRLNA